jgi:superoxide dismutase, Cu-Zn family
MKYAIPALLVLSVLAAACATTSATQPAAVAALEPRSGSQASGTVRFVEGSDGVTVIVDITGTTPGEHGFHVHDKGDCSAADATSAGPHYDVGGNPHGGPATPAHHTGDFGNLTADSSGAIRTQFTTRTITVGPGANSVVGKAVILHASADDLTSQPAGNSGARIACGVANLQVNGSNQP